MVPQRYSGFDLLDQVVRIVRPHSFKRNAVTMTLLQPIATNPDPLACLCFAAQGIVSKRQFENTASIDWQDHL